MVLGGNHEFGPDVLVKVCFADDFELERGFLERKAVLVCVFCRLAGGIVADDGVKASDEHQAVVAG